MMEPRVADVESAMLRACAGSPESSNPVLLAVQYHLSRPGHFLRGRLCLEACARLGVSAENAILAATVCELLQNASLLQDDLMDRSPMRRGQGSVWSQFGDGVAICAGDLMLAAAYASLPLITPATLLAEVVRLVHARTRDLICGQAEDLQTAAATASMDRYRQTAVAKSAPLISLALELPLTLAGLGSACMLARKVAAAFAVAYQIVDDLDDVTEDERAGCMNVVPILMAADALCPAEAKRVASVRAEEHLDGVIALAKGLPEGCAAVLTDHATHLRAQLSGANVSATATI